MFDIDGQKWFSLFKRGVELLADMSTFQFSATATTMQSRQQFPQPLQTGNVKGKVPYNRDILLKKAKTAAFQRQHLGRASHNKWAWRPTEIGHGVPEKSGSSKWAWRPSKPGHDVPVWTAENIIQFGSSLVNTFFPSRCSEQWWSQAMAASDWIKDSKQWQQCPWYEPILGCFQFPRQGKHASQVFKWPKRPILCKIAKKIPMVEKKYTRPQCPSFNNTRCDSSLPFALQPFNAALLQKSGGNPNGNGKHSGIFGRGCLKRNFFATSKASYPLVCDKKGRKTEIDHQLQRIEQLPGPKTF